MRLRKIMYIFVLAVFLLTACGKETEEKVEMEQPEESRDNQVEDANENDDEELADSTTVTDSNIATGSSNNTTTNPSVENNGSASDNSNTTTGNTTKKPSTGNNGNSGSTNSDNTSNSGSNNSGNSNNSGSTGNTSNNNSGTTTQPSTPVHEHKWIEVTEEVKHYYAWRTICNTCGTDLTDMTVPDKTYHVGKICGGSYAAYYKEVDFVTDNVQTETIITGYKCECGAEK